MGSARDRGQIEPPHFPRGDTRAYATVRTAWEVIVSSLSVNTSYINVTEAAHVRDDHSYFKDRAVNKNKKLKQMFAALFEGRRPESELKYRPDINAYELR